MTAKSIEKPSVGFPTVKELLGESWELVRNHGRSFLGLWVLLTLSVVVCMAVSVGMGIGGFLLVTNSTYALFGKLLLVIAVFCFVASFYVLYWGSAAHFYLAWLVVQKKPVGSLKSLYKESKPYVFPYIWSAFLYGMLIAIGFIFLVIPGIVLAFLFGLSQFVVFSEQKKGFAALKRGKELLGKQTKDILYRWVGLAAVHILLYIAQVATSFIPGVGIVLSLVGGICLYFVSTVYGFLVYRYALKAHIPSGMQNQEVK